MAGSGVRPTEAGDPQSFGPYRVLGRLGSGAMGRVYLASSPGGRLVAVKTLLAEAAVGDADRERFAREVKLARRVKGIHTVDVVAADVEAQPPWMATEYVPAPSLAELVQQAGTLPAGAVERVAAGAAEALLCLHRAEVVHRDVKPSNILLPPDGPRLIDFGISHAADTTRTMLTLGTIAFTSPEQASGEPSTTASDVYSLGATLFHLAVGRPPYTEVGDTLRLLSQVSRGQVDLSGLPPELEPLILPCLRTDPEERPEPARIVGQLADALADGPASPGGTGWLPPTWARLVDEYGRRGQELQRGAARASSPDAPTENLRNRGASGSPTRPYTRLHDHPRPAGDQQRPDEDRPGQDGGRPGQDGGRPRPQGVRPRPERVRPSTGTGSPAGTVSAAAAETRRTEKAQKGWGGVFLLVAAVWFFALYQQNQDDGPSAGAASTGSSSGAGSQGYYTPPPSPTPEPEDLAFRAVSPGDCLDAYRDGEDWNTDVPRTVDCDAASAYFWVSDTSDSFGSDCPTGAGRSYWSHVGTTGSTTLCVQRQFREGQCFVAKQSDKGTVQDGLLTNVWNCDADTVPSGYNQILRITGYYKAPKTIPRGFCSEDQYDRTSYWTWEVDDGKSVLCTTVA
ncbi:serine/threonine protein kinase [Streptomyces sp. HB2AG]|uniref:serine/threonine protein kinase n=1 Tax=Streptomyces sp. HB2AG TaxID=2983400 RepID=UPI0022AA3585|nr:protein kinase [Streptomyces sp. HB2AG]MCZ2525431.1 protein kinase [Streptomyces sp. HB2AG]